jgi:hypothetical protein
MGPRATFKLYGKAVDVHDPERRAAYRATVRARIDWEPSEPTFHCFAVDIESAGFMIFGEERYGLAWDMDGGLPRWRISDSG